MVELKILTSGAEDKEDRRRTAIMEHGPQAKASQGRLAEVLANSALAVAALVTVVHLLGG